MSKNFDELFEEFFEKPKKDETPKGDSSISKKLDGLIDSLKESFNTKTGNKESDGKSESIDEDFIAKNLDKLGDADIDETTEDGDSTIRKQTWETEGGTFSKITISGGSLGDDDDDENPQDILKKLLDIVGIESGSFNKRKPKELTLQERLDIAVENEEYEEAARIKLEIDEKQSNN